MVIPFQKNFGIVLTNSEKYAIFIPVALKEGEPMAQKAKLAIALDKHDLEIITVISENECRTRSNVIQVAVKEFLKNHGYYQTAETVKRDDVPQHTDTKSPTTGENIKAVSEPIEPTETDAQQPEPTTGEPSSVPERSGISGKPIAPLPDSWKK